MEVLAPDCVDSTDVAFPARATRLGREPRGGSPRRSAPRSPGFRFLLGPTCSLPPHSDRSPQSPPDWAHRRRPPERPPRDAVGVPPMTQLDLIDKSREEGGDHAGGGTTGRRGRGRAQGPGPGVG